MTGYKITVGFNNDGPFPALVTLEIPEDAVVVKPREYMSIKCFHNGDNSTLEFPKMRTNKAKVVNIEPLASEDSVDGWNKKAYSLFCLSNIYTENFGNEVRIPSQFFYKTGEEVVSDFFDNNCLIACTCGIHFFETKTAAGYFYYQESVHWGLNIVQTIKKYWIRFPEEFRKRFCEKES